MNDRKATGHSHNKALARLLKLLAGKTAAGMAPRIEGDTATFTKSDRGYRFPVSLLAFATDRKYAVWRRDRLVLTGPGRAALAALLGIQPGGESRSLSATTGSTQAAGPKPGFNLSESPLSRLYTRKTRGQRYIDDNEFAAGERLRADFEKGQLQPGMTLRYDRTVAGSSGGGNAGAADISDFALDARDRVNRAIGFLGPELAGVAVDVCCFLKGLEQVERERRWPPRSAKLMLRTALSRLADHYGFSSRQPGGKGAIVAWGKGDHRPHLFPGTD